MRVFRFLRMNNDVFDKLPTLQTERLDFRLINKSDTGLLFEFNSDPEALKFVPRTPFTDISQAEKKFSDCESGFENQKARRTESPGLRP